MSTIVKFGLFCMAVAVFAWFKRRVREAHAAQLEYDRRRAEVVMRAAAAKVDLRTGGC